MIDGTIFFEVIQIMGFVPSTMMIIQEVNPIIKLKEDNRCFIVLIYAKQNHAWE